MLDSIECVPVCPCLGSPPRVRPTRRRPPPSRCHHSAITLPSLAITLCHPCCHDVDGGFNGTAA
eukprot:150476-Chlamydomonas_euryale.AAC.2